MEASFLAPPAAAKEKGVQAGREVWLEFPPFQHAMRKPDVSARVTEMVSDYSGWHWLNISPTRNLDPPAIERLNEIQCPTLVILGGSNPPDYHRIGELLEEGISNTRRVVLPGVGHVLNMEDPENFNEAVLKFLAKASEAPG